MAAAQGTKDNCERARDVGERAVTAGGLHVAEGSTIWDAYRSGRFLRCHAGVTTVLQDAYALLRLCLDSM